MSLKKVRPLPEQAYLKDLFEYNAETGKLSWARYDLDNMQKWGWKSRRCKYMNSAFSGKEAGHVFQSTNAGELSQVRIDKKSYYVSRIIYKLWHGEEPDIVDHINGNPLDNRIENLRSVSNTENTRNQKRFSNNTSGYTGVSWDKNNKKWEAYYWNDYRKNSLGLFANLEDAVAARESVRGIGGFHANHGRG